MEKISCLQVSRLALMRHKLELFNSIYRKGAISTDQPLGTYIR